MSRLFSTTVDLDHWAFPDKERPHTELAYKIIPLLRGYNIKDLKKAVESIETFLIEDSFIDYQE